MVEVTEGMMISRLVEFVQNVKQGLDPGILASWYRVVEAEAKALCPEELSDTISVVQDPILWMKFEFKASRRAVPYILEAIEKVMPSMPFATRLYFQKLGEIIEEEFSHVSVEEAYNPSE